ncbi:hypothetical protein CEXT_314261 [Caerostris extrusa]|uniref:Uncharacterized protein n=1 Tax=Caerostris extrusa TaxID=172846 RepID=A0AAV4XEQ9_CAEEX|nr:hypothetical protein CEXT_314261 [Caerostris extrusa]
MAFKNRYPDFSSRSFNSVKNRLSFPYLYPKGAERGGGERKSRKNNPQAILQTREQEKIIKTGKKKPERRITHLRHKTNHQLPEKP